MPEATLEIEIDETGRLAFIHDDRLAWAGGVECLKRASHVEPGCGGWTADMGPVGGPVLGPFATRGEALTAEREWINAAGVIECAEKLNQ